MAKGDAGRIRGDLFMACSWDYGCLCQFGAALTQAFCEGIIGFHSFGHSGRSSMTDRFDLSSP